MGYDFKKRDLDILDTHEHVNKRAARTNFARIISDTRMERKSIVITDHGEPAAALISIDDLRILDAINNMVLDDELQDLEIIEGEELTKAKLRALLTRKSGNRRREAKNASSG